MGKPAYTNQITIANKSTVDTIIPAWCDTAPEEIVARLQEKARWLDAPLAICRIPLRANVTAVFRLVDNDEDSDVWAYELTGIEELVFHPVR